MNERVRALLIFDRVHDEDLRDELVAQSLRDEAIFAIVAESEASQPGVDGDEVMRAQVRDADEVIVMCGQHTESSAAVGAAFRVVLEEQKPYLLLWGRREIMCTKPQGAKPGDGMYSWTGQILEVRIQEVLRHTRSRDAAHRRDSRPVRKPGA